MDAFNFIIEYFQGIDWPLQLSIYFSFYMAGGDKFDNYGFSQAILSKLAEKAS